MSNFHRLEVVGHDSYTQLQVGENFTKLPLMQLDLLIHEITDDNQ